MNIKIPTHDSLSAALLSRAKHGSVIIGLDEIDLAQLGITQSTPVSAAFAAHGFATTDPATSTTTAHDPATADFATADPAAHALATADIATSTTTAHDPATADFATAEPAAHALATADIATSTTTAHDPATASPYTARRLRLTQRDGFALHSATASPYARRQAVKPCAQCGCPVGKPPYGGFSTVCCTPLPECSFILVFKMKAKFLNEENAFTPHEHTSCPPRRSVK